MAKVTTIPATIHKFSNSYTNHLSKRKVAGYARVSTDSTEQTTSYEAQVDYYENYIKNREDWEYVNVYTDDGISGTSTKYRSGFNKMVEDALEGKFSLIITKSVSRFARNTVDSLTTIRKLKEKGVECYFEKENIWTFDGKGELLLTIMSSLAQEESRSISENVKWGHRKRFADGKVTVPYSRFLGYDKGEDGNLVINEEEAVVVRYIYKLLLKGLTPHSIAKQLTYEKVPTPASKEKWSPSSVKSILTNEKYKGDALLQKHYTVDFLTKKRKINEGEIAQYYVEGSHDGIVSVEVFEMVQTELSKRLNATSRYSGVDMFSSKIICGECGGFYGSKVWHSNSKYRRVIYQCNHKFKNESKCSTPHINEEAIQEMFVQAVNSLIANKKEIIANVGIMQKVLFDNTEIDNEKQALLDEITTLTDTIQNMITENSRKAQDQELYQENYAKLVQEYDWAKAMFNELEQKKAGNLSRRAEIEHFAKSLKGREGLVDEFDEVLFCSLLEKIVVRVDGKVKFVFRDGSEIEV